jgi:succinoglycan biosynthesis protein ExoA
MVAERNAEAPAIAPVPIRRVSVVAPMLNEAEHIGHLVADLAAQDFDGELEVLVADGGSRDGSVERLRVVAERYELPVTILRNRKRWVSFGLNACIRAARGDLIIRMDCHSRYPSDYVRRCAIASQETGAENVGGVFIPTGQTAMERAVASAVDSPFGGVHWTRHGTRARADVDTVPYGAFRPDAFRQVGLFDESLVRNQDDEFNLRLRLAGGRIVLDPAIRVYYVPRGKLSSVFRQYYEYGLWKPAVMRKHGRVVSGRSLVPGAFVASSLVLALLAVWFRPAIWLLALEAVAYLSGAIVFGVASLRRRHEPSRLLPRVVAVFLALHVGYGLGILVGTGRELLSKVRAGLSLLRRSALAGADRGRGLQPGPRTGPAPATMDDYEDVPAHGAPSREQEGPWRA